MSINIRIDGNGDDELRSLHNWLLDEPGIRRHAKIQLVAGEPGPGEMGTTLEIIKLATESGFQVMNLALAFAAWRQTRPKKTSVTIERDGTTVTLSDADSDEVGKIIKAIGTDRP
jgi:hypothetical protein